MYTHIKLKERDEDNNNNKKQKAKATTFDIHKNCIEKMLKLYIYINTYNSRQVNRKRFKEYSQMMLCC